MRLPRLVIVLASVLLASWVSASTDRTIEDPRAVILRAMAEAKEIPAQARALADLAWPDPGDDVPAAVREAARAELVGFGSLGEDAVARVVRGEPAHSADALRAYLEIRDNMNVGLPRDFVAVLDEALWFGSDEARRIAIDALGEYGRALNVQAMIDCAEVDPSLVVPVIEALSRIRDTRARFWLAGFLDGDDPALRRLAADALAVTGGPALDPIAECMLSGTREQRVDCAAALAPVAGPEQLTLLYEYLAAHPDDDPEVVEAVRGRALAVEKAMDTWIESESASGDDR